MCFQQLVLLNVLASVLKLLLATGTMLETTSHSGLEASLEKLDIKKTNNIDIPDAIGNVRRAFGGAHALSCCLRTGCVTYSTRFRGALGAASQFIMVV